MPTGVFDSIQEAISYLRAASNALLDAEAANGSPLPDKAYTAGESVREATRLLQDITP